MSVREPELPCRTAYQSDMQPRKTREAWDEPDHAHFLTYSCHKRAPLLVKDRVRRWVVEAMEQTRATLNIALFAYVIMPEHVHVLLFPKSDCPMRRVLATLKRGVSQHARKHLMDTGPHEWLNRLTVRYPSRTVFRFWQPGGGYDHNVWRERTVRDVADYVHANPVRRGLVESPEQWTWSSAGFWKGEADVPIMMDSIDL